MNKRRFLSLFLSFVTAVSCLSMLPETDAVHTAYADESMADAEVTFSVEAGANIDGKTVALYAPTGYDIYYTTDGSDPTTASEKYTQPLSLKANSSRLAAETDKINVGYYRIYDNSTLPTAITLKAIAAASDGTTTPIATRTYFFQNREPVVVISISTDYSNLLDYDTGIMVKGAYYDAWFNTPEAQFIIANHETWLYQGNFTQKGREWERPASIEIFDDLYGKETYILENCGIRVRGSASRIHPQKSFNIYFRSDYGSEELNYSLFDEARGVDGYLLTSYKGFMLRNGGNAIDSLKFHDALIQKLAKNLDVATQASRPAVLYLNGEYMGIYVLQEKFSDKYFADHYDVAENNVIIIEEGAVDEGKDEDIALYKDLMSYAGKDLSVSDTYNEFCSIVDITSMIDYYAIQIYIGNADWGPEKNTRLWRVRLPENDDYGDGKWRWILYDTEYSSSLYNQAVTAFSYDSFTAALENDPLFASAMKNTDFYNQFTEKIDYLANNTFSPDMVNAELNRLASLYHPYMPNYYKRFGSTSWVWDSSISGIKTFFANRLWYIWSAVQDYQP